MSAQVPLNAHPAAGSRAVAVWLLVCAVFVFAMVVLGGVTRLTRSGLSIVEWAPIVGTIPPLDAAAWDATFDKYKNTPEYREVNTGMSLDEFKSIFWIEYAHRLLGRAIGFVFLIPFLYFLARRRLDARLASKLGGVLVLGALQGALGWYMVASGLVDVPRVSPYRLTAHLGLAVAIYGALLWIALDLLMPAPAAPMGTRPLARTGIVVVTLVSSTILAGGFVAGTHAGFVFNTFPLMDGAFVPAGLYALEPWWTNWFENVAAVQFHHRLLAYVSLVAVIVLWWKARRAVVPAASRAAIRTLAGIGMLQVMLGIATVVLVVPIPLAAAHQAGAMALFSAALVAAHLLRRRSY